MINAPVNFVNALTSGNFTKADLIEINVGDAYDLGSDVIFYYTTCGHQLRYNSQDYSPLHGITGIEGIARKASTGSDKVDIKISITQETLIDAIKAERYVNKPVHIKRVLLDSNGDIIDGYALPVRTAWAVSHAFEGEGNERECILTIDSVLGDLNGDNGWYAINASHERRHPGDKIMKHSGTVMTEAQRDRYTTNFNGVINEQFRPPSLPVIYGIAKSTPLPILMLRHRHTHSTYRHYFTTFIYVVSIDDAIPNINSLRKDGEPFDFNLVTDEGFEYGGWSLRFKYPGDVWNTIDQEPKLNFWRQRMDGGELSRLSNMLGNGLTLMFVINRNRDDWIQAPPEFTMECNGKALYDPRLGTTSLSADVARNPALQYYDFLTDTRYGAGNRNITVSESNFIDLANHFDNLPGSSGNPGINRILSDLQMDTGRPLVENMNIWMETFRLYTADYFGEFVVSVETIQSSVIDIHRGDLVADNEPKYDSGEFTDKLNKLTYTIEQSVPDNSPDAQAGARIFVDVEATFPEDGSQLETDWLAEDGGVQLFETRRLENIKVLEQAIYWTMVDARTSRQPRTLEIKYESARGWLLEPGDVLRYFDPILKIDAGDTQNEWRIEEVSEDEDGYIDLKLIAYANEFYSPDPNVIPDPVAPAQPPGRDILPLITGAQLVFEDGSNKLDWNKLPSSDVAWYAVEVWEDEDTETEEEALITQVLEIPKILEPPLNIDSLVPGDYFAYIEAYRVGNEGSRATLAFTIVELVAPTVGIQASNFSIQLTPTMVDAPENVKYEVLMNTVDDINTADNLGYTTGTLSIINRPPNTLHYFWVRTVIPAGSSQYTAVTVTTTNDGTIYNNLIGFDVSDGKSAASLTIYRRSSGSLTTPSGGSFNFDTLTLVAPNDWSTTIPAGTDPLYACVGIASVTGTTGADTDIPWSQPEILVRDGTAAASGKSIYQGVLYQRAPSAPSAPADNSAAFNFGSNGYDTLPAGWSPTIPAGSDPVYATYATFFVTGDTGVDSTQTWSAPVKVAEDGSDGQNAISTYTFNIYLRALSPPSTPTGGSYNFGFNTVVEPAGGWSRDIPAGDDPIYVSTTTASVTGATGVDNSLSWTPPILFVRNGADAIDGTDGKSIATLTIYKRDNGPPAAPSGGGYSFTNDILTAPEFWSAAIPGGTEPLYASVGVASVVGTTGADNSISWSTPELLVSNGQDGAIGKSIYQSSIFRRLASPPSSAPNGGSFDFGDNTLTPPSGWSASVPAGSNPVYISTGTFSISGDTGIDNSVDWSTPVLFVENGNDGEGGISTFTYYVYQRASSPPSTPSGGSYNFGSNTITPPNDWSATIPAGSDPLYASIALASITGATGTDTSPTYQTPEIIAQDGPRGSRRYERDVTSASAGDWEGTANQSWSDSLATGAIPVAERPPVVGDVVVLYNNTTSYSETRFWNGSAWQLTTYVIDGSLIVNVAAFIPEIFASQITVTGFIKVEGSDSVVKMSGLPGEEGIIASYQGTPYFVMQPGNQLVNGNALTQGSVKKEALHSSVIDLIQQSLGTTSPSSGGLRDLETTFSFAQQGVRGTITGFVHGGLPIELNVSGVGFWTSDTEGTGIINITVERRVNPSGGWSVVWTGSEPVDGRFESEGNFWDNQWSIQDTVSLPIVNDTYDYRISVSGANSTVTSNVGLTFSVFEQAQGGSGGSSATDLLPLNNTWRGYNVFDVNGGGTIAGADFDNGWVRIGTPSSAYGWAIDPNEMYAKADGIMGSLSGTHTIRAVAGNVDIYPSGETILRAASSEQARVVNGGIRLNDDKYLQLGTGNRGHVYHNANDLFVRSNQRHVYVDAQNNVYFRTNGVTQGYVFSGGMLLLDNKELRLGTSSQFRAEHNGTDTVFNNFGGHLYIQNLHNGSNNNVRIRSQLEGTGSTTYDAIAAVCSTTYVRAQLYYNGATKMHTDNSGIVAFGRMIISGTNTRLDGTGVFDNGNRVYSLSNPPPDTNTTYSAGNGLNLAGTEFSADFGTGSNDVCRGNDSRLSNSRNWNASRVGQTEAEAGTATTDRKWTSQRVRQAIAAYAAQISHNHSASNITSGTFSTSRIPSLDASKITSGTFGSARIPSLDASKITSGTFSSSRIPNLNASKITSGTLPVSRGGTGVTTSTGTGATVRNTSPSFAGTATFSAITASSTITASGIIQGSDARATSDKRKKFAFQPIENVLVRLDLLKGGTFNRYDLPGRHGGTYAQDWLKAFPEAVGKDPQGYYNLSANAQIGFLVEVDKAQKREIETLKRKLSEQESRLANIERRLAG